MNQAVDLVSIVQHGRLTRAIERQLDDCIRRSEGKYVKITIQQKKKFRSLKQNAYYWSVIVQAALGMFLDAGNSTDSEQVHDYLREHVGNLVAYITDPKGNRKKVLRSTAELSTVEFEEYLEKCRAWAAEYGVIIPLPKEILSEVAHAAA